jgi:hypothetical protein
MVRLRVRNVDSILGRLEALARWEELVATFTFTTLQSREDEAAMQFKTELYVPVRIEQGQHFDIVEVALGEVSLRRRLDARAAPPLLP